MFSLFCAGALFCINCDLTAFPPQVIVLMCSVEFRTCRCGKFAYLWERNYLGYFSKIVYSSSCPI